MKKILFFVLWLFFVFPLVSEVVNPDKSLKGVGDLNARKAPGQYLEIELKRLEETYRLLDRFAEKIWPGWDNYNEIEVKVHFPNNVHLLINPRNAVSVGYKKLQGRTLGGKCIFINREKELPIKLKPPLVAVRGSGGLSLRIQLRQLKLPPGQIEKLRKIEKKLKGMKEKETGFDLAPKGDSDGHILMYIHEFFHGFQQKIGLMRWGDRGLNKFKINTEYAAYSSIEGLALKNAFSQKDHAKALEYLKDYIVAREIKQTYMPLEAVLDEQFLSVLEGTPSYSSLKMAMLIRDMAYKPRIHQQDDPFFFKFKFIDGYLENILEKGLLFAVGLTIDKRGKYYLYGAYQCFILDRFVPGWKQNFFRKKKNLDQLIANFLNLSPAQKKVIVNRLKTKYSFDDLYAKHDAIIKKRVQKEK